MTGVNPASSKSLHDVNNETSMVNIESDMLKCLSCKAAYTESEDISLGIFRYDPWPGYEYMREGDDRIQLCQLLVGP